MDVCAAVFFRAVLNQVTDDRRVAYISGLKRGFRGTRRGKFFTAFSWPRKCSAQEYHVPIHRQRLKVYQRTTTSVVTRPRKR